MIFYVLTLLCFSSASTESANWMEQAWDQIANKTLQNITLPGTHDSGSYSVVEAMIGVPPWIEEIVYVAEILGLQVGQVVDGWARSQPAKDNFYQQFLTGIRYIDLRIVYDAKNKVWRTHHNFVLGTNVSDLLQQTASFLAKYTKEVIILELSHNMSNTIEQQKELVSMIESYLSPHLWPPAKGFVPIGEMVSAGKNVLLTLPFGELWSPLIWPAATIVNSYANSDDVKTMENYNSNIVTQWANYRSFNNSDLAERRREMEASKLYLAINRLKEKGRLGKRFTEQTPPSQYLYKMSWTLTPDVATILKMIIPGEPKTLLELAAIGNKNLMPWFNATLSSNPHWNYPYLCNIIIIDDALNSPIFRVTQYNPLP